jgi:uncharacterized protein with von Willebrand factor type A (vWA) domain
MSSDRADGAGRDDLVDRGEGRARRPGGIVHTYLGYDPRNFPSPTAPPPDVASAAFEHMLSYGTLRHLTEDELADAVKLDISQIAGLGPSLDSLIAMLEERKRRILETYEVESAMKDARKRYAGTAREITPPKELRERFKKAVDSQQVRDIERLYYDLKDDTSDLASDLTRLAERLGEMYQVDQLSAKYAFTGRTPTDAPKALELKEELEAIDRLLEQLREAMKNAKIGVIDLDELARFASESQVEDLGRMQEQVREMLREAAERQGVEETSEGFRLTPQAYRIFQGRLLNEIFDSLQESRSGRHDVGIEGDGPVELAKTKPYEFGDSVASMDITQTFVNAMVRDEGVKASRRQDVERGEGVEGAEGTGRGGAFLPEDIEIHRTRNNPKCATCVLIDMSGSMRFDGQYANAKRMALALDGLIRREYPGDYLKFIELFSFARARDVSEIPSLMPRPVTVRNPVVRLKADMSDPEIAESQIPPHFTNIQRGLQLSRQMLGAQDTPNRQVILITDGLPTAHFEGSTLYLLYPPDPRTEQATMREAALCVREGITINIFLLPNWAQSEEDVQFAHRLAELTRGRVFFTGGRDLSRFVLWDYVKGRRKIIG